LRAEPRSRIGVLVVDDQHFFRRAVVALIRSVPSLEVLGEARSGEEAVEMAHSLAPDFVLMDVKLPGIDGVTATARIVSDLPSTRVLLVSTYELADLPARMATCGAIGFSRKQDLDARVLLDSATTWTA